MSSWNPINFYATTLSDPSSMQPCHMAQGSILGEDGKRYAVIQIDPGSGNSHYPVIYCYDTNTALSFGASSSFSAAVTKMQADLTTLALPGAPASAGFAWIDETCGIANTSEFIVIGQAEPGSGDELAFIRYKINSSGAITLVDGFIVRCASTIVGQYHTINWRGIRNQSELVDCRIIGSTLYIAGSGQSASANIYDTVLLAFPLSIFGTSNTTIGSLEAYVTVTAHGRMFLNPFSPSYINGQRGCIVQVGSMVGLLAYAGAGSIKLTGAGNQFFSGGTEYNGKPRLIFSGDVAAFTDYGATFGVPFSDTLFDFAGTLTSDINNDYNGPSFLTKGADLFLIFTRVYNDAIQEMRMKMFSWPVGKLLLDFTGTYWPLGHFPGAPHAFAPVNVFYSPDGTGHLILQSDFLAETTGGGTWRLYADFGQFPPSGGQIRRWLAELGPTQVG